MAACVLNRPHTCMMVCMVADSRMVDNVSGRTLRYHSIFCAVAWSFWRFFLASGAFSGSLCFEAPPPPSSTRDILFWFSRLNPLPVALLSQGCECVLTKFILCPWFLEESQRFSVLFLPFLSLFLSSYSPSPFLFPSRLHFTSDWDTHRAETTSGCALHSLSNTQASLSRLTKREIRLISD